MPIRQVMTKTGRVVDIDDDGDVNVDFDDVSVTLNPQVCHLVTATATKDKDTNHYAPIPSADVRPSK